MVLPAPLSPSTTRRLPRSTARSIPLKTVCSPYDLVKPTAASGMRPQGSGVGSRTRATRSALRAGSSSLSMVSARRTMFRAATAVATCERIFSACARSAAALRSALVRSLALLRSAASRSAW
ncbi:hypothetical protein SANTM175S_02193 [Streptomyces antimycoticus]